jgi:hypothetical protein
MITTAGRRGRGWLTLPALLAIGLLTTACDDSDVGLVRQSWTIEGTTDESRCSELNASQMRLIAVDGAGVVQGTEFAACGAFKAELRLPPGIYSVASAFLGADGQPVSRARAIDGLVVSEDEETTIDVDFPSSAFILVR